MWHFVNCMSMRKPVNYQFRMQNDNVKHGTLLKQAPIIIKPIMFLLLNIDLLCKIV